MRSFAFSSALLCALLQIALSSDYVYYESVQAAYKFHRLPFDWYTARVICSTEGASLAMPRNEAEKNILLEIFNEYPSASLYDVTQKDSLLLGFHDIFVEGEYRTLKGDPLQYYYNNRTSGKSDDAKDCGSLLRSGFTDEFPCKTPGVFICEKSNSTRSVVPQDVRCKSKGYALAEGLNKCYKIHLTQKTWYIAKDTCYNEDGNLAIVTSEKEMIHLSLLLRHELKWEETPSTTTEISVEDYSDYYYYRQNTPMPEISVPEDPFALLGFHDMYQEGQFVTIDDFSLHSLNYNNWEVNEPNNGGDNRRRPYAREDCGAMSITGKLKDVSCSKPAIFICEQPSVVFEANLS